MRTMLIRAVYLLAIGTLGAVPSRCHAEFVITGGAETAVAFYQDNFMQGYDFVSTTNQSLTALGFWDQGADGLPRDFQVGLWETSSQTLLASVTIDNADPLDGSLVVAGGQWRYESLLSPISLSSGTTYTLAVQIGSPELSTTDSLLIDSATISFGATVSNPNVGRFLETSSFTFPIGTLIPGPLFRGAINARVESSSAIPEPTSITLFGMGLFALGLLQVRRRFSVLN